MASQSGSTTVFVGNLPRTAKKETVEKVFGQVGLVKHCYVGVGKGIAYITYAIREDAEQAIKKIKKVEGNKVHVKFSNKRKQPPSNDATKKPVSKKPKLEKQAPDFRPKKVVPKNARLIVRNLSFNATDEDIHKSFDGFGKVTEVVIPTKDGTRKLGCCFVQYDDVESAKKAIEEMNAKKILGRVVAVDWCLPKNKFMKAQSLSSTSQGDVEIVPIEPTPTSINGKNLHKKTFGLKSKNSSKAVADSEDDDDDETTDDESEEDKLDREGNEEDDDSDNEDESEKDDDDNDNKSDQESDDEDDDELDDEDDDDDDNEFGKTTKKRKATQSKPKSDVQDGRTLFIRNLTFNSTEVELNDTMKEFGKVNYAILCIDPDTDHPRGTGFVQFSTKQEADECLKQANDESPEDGGIILNGKLLKVSVALTPEELQEKLEQKKTKKDENRRNLHLAREGLIRPGTLAADGVSASDMAKRQKVEMWKRQMLRNLHMFISHLRLCVRNIPPNMNDNTLRRIFQKAVKPGAEIIECRIIRDKHKFVGPGTGESKGFAFVRFTSHEDALTALRKINNNPLIFSKDQRPIVEFSVENRAALKAKEQRLLKSRQNLNQPKQKNNEQEGNDAMIKEIPQEHFMGSKATKKSKLGLPSHMGPKIRHNRREQTNKKAISRKNFKKNNLKKLKMKKKLESSQNNQIKAPKKTKTSHVDKVMDRLESQHRKKQRVKTTEIKKKKWFN